MRTSPWARLGAIILLMVSTGVVSCGDTVPAGITPTAMRAPSKLNGDFRVHDPSMIKQSDAYYVFSTGEEYGLNQGNIQMRRCDRGALDCVSRQLLLSVCLVRFLLSRREQHL